MTTLVVLAALMTVALLAVFYYWRLMYFFRDPDREVPGGHNIVAPADGKVIYVRRVVDGSIPLALKNNAEVPLTEFTGVKLPATDYFIIGIFMYPTSVHVNRTPISGTAKKVLFSQGRNRPMTATWWRAMLGIKPYDKYSNYVKTNERNTILIENQKMAVAVTQIADIYVNRVECWLREGERVEKGQKYGRIVFGSQVDTVIPIKASLRIVAREGQMVSAGESILAIYD